MDVKLYLYIYSYCINIDICIYAPIHDDYIYTSYIYICWTETEGEPLDFQACAFATPPWPVIHRVARRC